MPMLDLRQFLGSGATVPGRNTRIVVVNHRDIPAGLMVDEVLGFRRFAEAEFNAEAPPTVIRCDSYLAGAFRRGGEVWPVIEFEEFGGEPELFTGRELSSAEHAMSHAKRYRHPRRICCRCWRRWCCCAWPAPPC